MGLDNGIMVRRNEKSMSVHDKLERFETVWDKEHNLDFEIAYYRKCWNVRVAIFKALGGFNDNYETPVSRDDILKIVDALKGLNKENWCDAGGSIWEYEEQKPHIRQHIKNLRYLYRLMGKQDLDVYFYDSY